MKLILERYFENKENNTIIAEVSLKSLASFINKKRKISFLFKYKEFFRKEK